MAQPFTIVLDLANLRIGKLVKIERIVTMPNLFIIKYLSLRNPFAVREIVNVPEPAIIEVSNMDVGGVGDADKYIITLKGERGESPFLDKFLSTRYSLLIEEMERMKREMAIAKGMEKARTAQLTQDVLEKLKDLERVRKELEKPRPRKMFEVERV